MRETQRISTVLEKIRPSLTLALKRIALDRKSAGLPVFDFGLGEHQGTLNDHLREAGMKAFEEGNTIYGDPAGVTELRQAVLSWLDLEQFYTVDQVVISAGAKQSLFNIFLAVCNPGDVVLFDAAPWVSYQPLAHMAYASPVMVLPKAKDKTSMKIVPEDLQRNIKMRPHARLFLLNNPVNPTGQLYSQDEVNALLDVCVENKMYFVYDRLYWRLIYDGESFPSLPINERTKPWVIQVDGMSKNFRRTGGLRIGWSIAPDDVSKAMGNLQSHYTSGPAMPTQLVAWKALTHDYDFSIIEELQEKRDLIQKEAKDMPFTKVWHSPATYYSFWDVREAFGKRTPKGQTIQDSDDLAGYLMAQAGVIVASGASFMVDGYLRLSFTNSKDTIKNGMAAAREALSKLT